MLLLTGFTESEYYAIIFTLQYYTILRFINNIGNKIAFLDFLAFYTVLDTLLMPIWGYTIFNENNASAALWGKYMRVPQDTYFNFMIPANVFLILGMNQFQKLNTAANTKILLQNMKNHLSNKGKIGVYFIIIGFLSPILLPFIPGAFAHLFGLLSWLRFVGPIYLYYSDYVFKKQILYVSVFLFFLQAVKYGMFGEFFMYFSLLAIIMAVNFKFSFSRKLVFFVSVFSLVFLIQSVKYQYRKITWKNESYKGISLATDNTSDIFLKLILEKLSNFESLVDETTLFGFYVRMNQGYLVSVVMDHVPSRQPFAQGTTIIRSIGGILLPRFIWPDKPESGGVENMRRFLGFRGKITFSMNIGPYGEGYGNFGPIGGIVYVFFYGLALAYMFHYLLKLCFSVPSLIVYFPFLFFYTLTVETDLIGTFNSLVKSGIFLYLLFWGAKRLFKVEL